MKKISTLLAILSVFGSFSFVQAHEYPTSANNETYSNGRLVWQTDFSTATALSKTTSKPILILFTGATWCNACVSLEKNVLTKPEFANAVGDKFVFFKAEFKSNEMNTSPYTPLKNRYNIQYWPTIIVVDANGEVLYSVKYQKGGPDVYANELLNKLNASRSSAPALTYTY